MNSQILFSSQIFQNSQSEEQKYQSFSHNSSYQQNEKSNKNKTKKISKQRRKTNTKKGRPPKNNHPMTNQQFNFEENSNDQNIKIIIINYLFSIGLKKGLVFKQKVRQRLRKQQIKGKCNQQIEWKNKHNWHKQTQKQKIYHAFKQFKNLLKNEELNKIQQKMLNFSDILADQCTFQFYKFMKKILESILRKQEINVKELYHEQIFLTGKFTKLSIRYEIQIIQQTQVYNHFKSFVFSIEKQLKVIFEFLNK